MNLITTGTIAVSLLQRLQAVIHVNMRLGRFVSER
jgi:hypothetical protein